MTPYPLLDTLSLPRYYLWPSARNRTDLRPSPIRGRVAAAPTARRVRLVFLGDIMPPSASRVPEISPELAAITASADLVVANCEGPVGSGSGTRRPLRLATRRPTQTYLSRLLDRLEVAPARCALSVANNHAGDRGAEAFRLTVERLRELGVTPVGSREDPDRPLEPVQVGELRVGVAAWTRWMNRDTFEPDRGVWRTPAIDTVDWPAACAAHSIDCLVGTPHWEYEFKHFPTAAARRGAARLARAGFAILAGHHPHVAQPVELIGPTLCLYSAGNLTGPPLPLRWPLRLGVALAVDVGVDEPVRGRPVAYEVHPYVQLDDGRSDRLEPLARAPRQLRRKIGARLETLFPTGGVEPLETLRSAR